MVRRSKGRSSTSKSQARKDVEGESFVSPIMGGIKKIGNIAKEVTGVGSIR